MAGAMSLTLYLAVLVISVTSVALGLDWLAAPPPPPGQIPVQVTRVRTPPSVPVSPPVRKAVANDPAASASASSPDVVDPVTKPVAAALPAASTPPATAAADVAPVSNVGSGVADGGAEAAGKLTTADSAPPAAKAPRCDVRACEAAYRSFRAEDCTWQPFEGPRRFCDKGNPPPEASPVAAGHPAAAQAEARAPACNIRACERAYDSFDPADCTWQPYQGPRRFCEK